MPARDDSEPWLRAHWPEVRFESSARQQGFAPTANRGVRAARFSLVYLVNNDVALTGTTLPPSGRALPRSQCVRRDRQCL